MLFAVFDGKTLYAVVGDGLKFSAQAADPPAGDQFSAPNPGVTILTVKAVAPESGKLRIPVALRPGKAPSLGRLKPMTDW